MNNVRKEEELYDPMCTWLQTYLEDKYRRQKAIVKTIDSHAFALDKVLEQEGVVDEYPQTVGLNIQIDVLGIVKLRSKTEIVFIEAKKTKLNLHDLGQLWAYCKLCDPSEAFLLSSDGLGSLDKVLNNLNRQDMLTFGDGRRVKQMQVGKWDILSSNVDQHSLVPKL